MPHARIGVSGWRYPSWRGDFYPKGLPQRLELTYAAERMTSIEINGSFYSLQRPSSYAAWRGAVPADVFQLERQPMLGSPDAPVTVVEFADFKCPYCRDFTLHEFPRFKAAYVDTGKVRFYFINYPFIGPDSDTAAEALEAVYAQDPEGAWAFIERVMQRQGPEDQQWATPEFLVELAREAVPSIDAERLAADLRARRYRDEVEADRAIARQVGVQGTPAIFVDGRFVDDWSFEGLKAAVEEALARRQGGAAPGDAE